MRRAVVVLGTTAAGLAALFSYKTHVAGVAVASTSPATPTMTASPAVANGGSLAASASVSASPSKPPVKKAKPKPSPTMTHAAPTTAPASTAPPQEPTAAPSTPAPVKSSAPAKPSGTFTGGDQPTNYGDVQVQITVANGKITAANDVQQPSDSIAANAVSQLNSEVLTAQSANIQAVSGATYTSQGYIQSLQQAVNQAGL
jgi:uncharacterized protein with FMN-binding domain